MSKRIGVAWSQGIPKSVESERQGLKSKAKPSAAFHAAVQYFPLWNRYPLSSARTPTSRKRPLGKWCDFSLEQLGIIFEIKPRSWSVLEFDWLVIVQNHLFSLLRGESSLCRNRDGVRASRKYLSEVEHPLKVESYSPGHSTTRRKYKLQMLEKTKRWLLVSDNNECLRQRTPRTSSERDLSPPRTHQICCPLVSTESSD